MTASGLELALGGASTPGLTAREMGAEGRAAWDAFVAGHPLGHYMQSYEWGEIRAASGWTPIRVAVLVGDEIRACAQVLEKKLVLGHRCVHYAPRGPIVDYHDARLLADTVNALRAVGRRRGATMLRTDPAVGEEDAAAREALDALGFRHSERGTYWNAPRHVFRLDLSPDEDALFRSFRQTTRNEIRQAARKGVVIENSGTPGDLAEFHQLMMVLGSRKGFPVRAYAHYRKLYDELLPRGLGKLFVARHDGTLIGGAFMATMGDASWWLHGATSSEHRKLMPSKALAWAMITWSKSVGRRWFDFLGSRLPGVADFKRGFRPTEASFIGCYDLPLRPTTYALWRAAESRGVPAAVAVYRAVMPRLGFLRRGAST
ncbi:MAG: peptidoglycan bridge formation glycyltransferase FemA/FemB family protein [Armatimonadota bacterium]|nr:MAG: peptidoglycan bridge formation glycyltransferase FemA/FemB family protein [Armatimonadota bacterium]